MFGPPAAVDGECNACLFLGDDYGDNRTTIRCQLPLNHDGQHREQFEKYGGNAVTITWDGDDRVKCDHGCGQWRHDHEDANAACPKDADDHTYSDCPFCNDGEPALMCGACGKTYYDEPGHQRHCTGQRPVAPVLEATPKPTPRCMAKTVDDVGECIDSWCDNEERRANATMLLAMTTCEDCLRRIVDLGKRAAEVMETTT